jgi:hypothetical protein
MNGNKINQIYIFHIFALVFLFFSFSLQLDILATATTSKVVMVQTSPPSRRRLVREGVPHRNPVAPLPSVLTKLDSPIYQTGPSNFYNFKQAT